MRWILIQAILAVIVALPGCGGDSTGQPKVTPAAKIGRTAPSVMRAYTWSDLTGVAAAQMLGPRVGWALTDERLAWTDDGGKTWREMTPPGLQRSDIQDVFFLDHTSGWVASLHLVSDEAVPAPITVWRTSDSGRTWESHSFNGPEVPRFGPPALGQIYLSFADEDHGWLSADYRTGMWRGTGLVYGTTDGGRSWDKVAEADGGGGPVRFVTGNLGWWSRGDNGPDLYVSRDGGANWELVNLPIPTGSQRGRPAALPAFDADGTGVLPLDLEYPHWSERIVFMSADNGESWTEGRSTHPAGALAFVDASRWYVADGMQLAVTADGGGTWTNVHGYWYTNDPLPGTDNVLYLAPAAMSLVDARTGWALLDSEHGAGPMVDGKYEAMTRSVALIATDDGGHNWRNLNP